MTFTYDPTTDRGKVRLLITDTNSDNAANQVFNDDEIDAFLSLTDDVVRRAAAMALRSIATNEALVQKVIRLQGLSTNGAQTAAQLRLIADSLEEDADLEEARAGGGFGIAEIVVDDFTYRDRLWNQALRGQL